MTKVIKNKSIYEEVFGYPKGEAISIIFPDSPEEIKNIIRLSKIDLIPRGSGSSLTGACFPDNSIIINMAKRNNIINFNENTKLIKVEAGTTLKEINEYIQNYNLEFPFNPIISTSETIGGAIAKNIGGDREIKYGSISRWIEYLEVIDYKGNLIKINKTDLNDFTGMEGTTGIIWAVSLKLTNRKSRTLSILKSNNFALLFKEASKIRLNHEVCSIDLLSREISFLLGFENKYHLLIEYENKEGMFKDKEYEHYNSLKNKIYFKSAQENAIFPLSAKVMLEEIPELIKFLEERKIKHYSNITSSTVYFFTEENQTKKEIINFCKKLNAKMMHNLGIGLYSKEGILNSDYDVLSRIKKRRDPESRFNSGKMNIYNEIQDRTKIGEIK
jgi:FAD/FMN-containing dehydrogenase